jgi:hypothetical protein
MPPRRRTPVVPAVEAAGGLDAAELRRRIQQHLDQHAAAGDTAAMAVEEVVLHADTGKVTVQQERVVVQPRHHLAPTRLPDLVIAGAGERVLGLPVEWYFRLVWPYAVFGAVIVAAIAWWGGGVADVLRLLVAAGIGIAVGVVSGRHGVNLGQSAVAGATAGAVAGLIASLLVLVTSWTLGSFLNIIVLPAYLAFVGALLAPAAALVWRRRGSRR